MKKSLLFVTFVLLGVFALCQTPQAIKYQTVARNNSGEILASQNISFRMTILQGALPGTVVYAEIHAATTNASGLVTLEIGRGTPVSGNFAAINWSTTPVFLKTEIDPVGGTAFIEMGTSELLSVPFSLYAKTAGNGFSGNYDDLTNKPALWDSTWLTIKNKPTTIAGYGITDAMTTSHAANGITSGNITNWNTAFGWGNHATAGYLTSFTETDPIWTAASSNYYTKTNMQTGGAASLHFNNLTNKPMTVAGYGITDAMTTAHVANGITSGLITNWNTAYTNRINTAGGTTPLTLTISNNQLSGSIAPANSTTSGYLTFADWNSFNNKVSSQWVTNGLNISYSAGKVGIGTSTPAQSATLEVSSTNSGVLLPRLTFDQRNAIEAPAEGLMVFCLNCGTNGSLSVFSNGTWRTFTECDVPATSSVPNTISPGQIIWNWEEVPGASGYKWSKSTGYGTTLDMGTETSKTETGIVCDSTYTRYVWVYNGCGISVPVTLSQPILNVEPDSPVAGTHEATQISIVWNWSTVEDATGYKWNTSNDFATATDMGYSITKNETDLTCEVEYTRYVWAYNGCGYSTPVALTQSTLLCWICGNPYTDYRDGQQYNTVQIGEQCWMSENMNIGIQIDGVNNQTDNGIIEKYCYNNSDDSCNVYGGLYNWGEAMNYAAPSDLNPSGIQRICPTGWHLPSVDEWCEVSFFLDQTITCPIVAHGGTNAGGKMKETGTNHWLQPNTGATNSSGFTALPGGYRISAGYFQANIAAYFWSTSFENGNQWPWYFQLNYDKQNVWVWMDNTYGTTIRCLKD